MKKKAKRQDVNEVEKFTIAELTNFNAQIRKGVKLLKCPKEGCNGKVSMKKEKVNVTWRFYKCDKCKASGEIGG